ncbi:MAG: zinc ABC transporter substrate-binding protein [Neisseriaceae bacterium]|nr:zinc ABC transporter substrate-binding protein [Neisseriaceae bacterium]
MKKVLFSLLTIFIATISYAAPAKLEVVASFSILSDLTREVGGDRVNVYSLVPAGQDAHVYQPTPSDIKKVKTAQVFVSNGLGFEGWQSRILGAANFKGQLVTTSAGVVPPKTSADHEHHDDHEVDPHAWHNPQNVVIYVNNITKGLSLADAAGASYYESRAAAYIKKVQALDNWAQQQYKSLSLEQRKVLTSHDAFSYLGSRYGIQFIAPQGLSTEAEPTAKVVAQLIQQVKKEKIKAVFLEYASNEKLLTQMSKEANVTIGGVLYADSLTKAGGEADTWLTFFELNTKRLVAAMK